MYVNESLKAVERFLLLWLLVWKLNWLFVQEVDVAHVSIEEVFWTTSLILPVPKSEVR